jgi:hypothetical protein
VEGTTKIVFVGGTCGSIHVESFHRNIKALGAVATGQGATGLLRTKGRDAEQWGGQEQLQGPGAYQMGHIRVKMARADLGRVLNASVGSVEIGVFCLSIIFFGLVKFVKFVVN